MNWTGALKDIAAHDGTLDANARIAALSRDTVYMPSELAAKLLPLAARRASEPLTRDRALLGEDRRAPAH